MGQYVKQAEEVTADYPRGRHDGRQEGKVALVVVVLVVVELLFDGIQCAVDVVEVGVSGLSFVCKFGARAVELSAQGHVYDAVPDSCQLKIFNPEACLLQSTAVWHVVSFSSESRLGEQPLQGSEDVLVCALHGSGVLRAALLMVAIGTADPRRHETPDSDSGLRFPDYEFRFSQLMYQ